MACFHHMPKIVRLPYELSPKEDHTRSPGVHASNIVRDIGLTMGYLKPEYANESKPHPVRVTMGLAWEDHIFPHHHPEVLYHPGETMVVPGVSGTCDGLSFDRGTNTDQRWVEFAENGEGVVHECKLTWKSMKKELDLSAEWMWLSQTMLYCWGWGMTKAIYHIMWVNGNYKYGEPDGEPNYRLYGLTFTKKELEDNAKMIYKRGKDKHGLK